MNFSFSHHIDDLTKLKDIASLFVPALMQEQRD